MMKFRFCLAVFSFTMISVARGENENPQNVKMKELVSGEYSREQQKLQNDLSGHKGKLAELDKSKAQAIAASLALSRTEVEGLALFKKYVTLLKVRYSDPKTGKYQEGLEIENDEVNKINSMFLTYLKWEPLNGKVSAGEAVKLLDKGYDQLDDLVGMHASPSEDNNSDLAIIAKQVEETNEKIEVVTELAQELGVSLNPNAMTASASSAPVDRAPAGSASLDKTKR